MELCCLKKFFLFYNQAHLCLNVWSFGVVSSKQRSYSLWKIVCLWYFKPCTHRIIETKFLCFTLLFKILFCYNRATGGAYGPITSITISGKPCIKVSKYLTLLFWDIGFPIIKVDCLGSSLCIVCILIFLCWLNIFKGRFCLDSFFYKISSVAPLTNNGSYLLRCFLWFPNFYNFSNRIICPNISVSCPSWRLTNKFLSNTRYTMRFIVFNLLKSNRSFLLGFLSISSCIAKCCYPICKIS